MPRFAVYCGPLLIGWSDFEAGDPPMGVVFGKLICAPEYSTVRADIFAAADDRDLEPTFTVREVDGEYIESSGGVHITDFDEGDEDIEVSILGIIHPSYESLFPEQVAAYERQFARDG